MSHVFSLIGDSNVRRNINKNSCRGSPFLKACQVIFCGNLENFVPSLGQVRAESSICLISCLTNFIASAEGSGSVAPRVDPVLQEVRDALLAACASKPTIRFMISPPMYRSSPLWYRDGLPEILTHFSQIMNSEKPANMLLLSSFPTPDFIDDGIHLTPYSGLEFVLNLFDGAQDLLEKLSSGTEGIASSNSESTRVLEDRLVALEQDHRRLNRVVDDKIAIDAEMSDFIKNERFEDSLIVEGTERIPDEIVGKAWQDLAVSHVLEVLKILMGRDMKVVFVQNATSRAADAVTAYSVKMLSVAESKAVRTKFGTYFLGNVDKRPEALKPYSIKNRVTAETKIRISLLKLLAKRYRDSNPGSKVQVIGYDPRPLIKITPAPSASDRRVKSYHYVEAVRTLPATLSPADVAPIIRRINPKLKGQIRLVLFIIFSRPGFSGQPNILTYAQGMNFASSGLGRQVSFSGNA